MTNYNSGFNPNFNPNINPNLNPKPNQGQGLSQNNIPNNPYINTIRQPFLQQQAINNTEAQKQNLLNEQEQNPIQTEKAIAKTEIYDYNKVKMDSEVLLKYLQNVMKMPENINKLLTTLDSPIIKALVGKNIDVKVLGEILNTNSASAVEKILKAISESLKSGIKDVSQLKDVLGMLSAIQNSTSNNAVKELLLLYIPVNPPIFDKTVDFKSGSKDEEDAINNSAFSLIFETVNFSNISCCINSLENTLYVEVFADKNFPFERFKKVIDTFKKEMNLRVETENKFTKRVEDDKERIRNFNIISSGFVSFDILILAHLIVKTIFKIDETFENKPV